MIPQRIILICSTAHSDSNKVFESLKNLDWERDVITDYSDAALLDKMEELKKDIQDSKTLFFRKSLNPGLFWASKEIPISFWTMLGSYPAVVAWG